MARPDVIEPVKVLAAILWREPQWLEQSLSRLTRALGAIDFESGDYGFAQTGYYEAEMGQRLSRRIVSFQKLQPPEQLANHKLTTNAIEEDLADSGRRHINIDVGYLDFGKVVLASAKYGSWKLGIGSGIYADMILRYDKGQYHSFPWTFPDFRDGRYDRDLLHIRAIYKEQLRLGTTG